MTTNAQKYPELTDKIGRAKAKLILYKAFYGSIVCNRTIIIDENTPTASCSAKGTIRMGPKFCEDLKVDQIMFLLAHETMHYAMHHLLRKGAREMPKWNWATDAWINETLILQGVGEFIDGGIRYPGAQDMTSDDLYGLAPEQPPGGGGGSLGEDLSNEDGYVDPAEAEAIEARAKIEITQAAKAAKAQGTLPAGLERLIDEMTKVKTPWYDILERYMQGMVRDESTWQRPNKRMHHMGVYLPSKGYVPSMGPVVIGLDTSGSIGAEELAMFFGHINRIMETCRPQQIYVVQCDAQIGHVDEFTVDDLPLNPARVTGGGGTSFVPVFEWIDEQGIEPDVVVYLTDGYGDQSEVSTTHQAVWLTTGSTEFPFGVVIPFEE